MLDLESADHALVAALEHLDHYRLALAATRRRALAAEHSVAVQHLLHLGRAEEQVAGGIVRHQETEAVGMALHPTADQVHLGRQSEGAAPIGDHLAFALHGCEAAREAFCGLRGDVQDLGQPFGLHRHACFSQGFEDLVPLGDDGREDRFIRSPESGTTTILRGQLTKPAWLNTFPASMPRWRNW